RLGKPSGSFEHEACPSVGMVELSVFEEAPLDSVTRRLIAKWPLNAARLIDLPIVRNSAEVARLTCGECLEELKDRLRAVPLAKEFSHASVLGDESEDVKVGEGVARCPLNFAQQ